MLQNKGLLNIIIIITNSVDNVLNKKITAEDTWFCEKFLFEGKKKKKLVNALQASCTKQVNNILLKLNVYYKLTFILPTNITISLMRHSVIQLRIMTNC